MYKEGKMMGLFHRSSIAEKLRVTSVPLRALLTLFVPLMAVIVIFQTNAVDIEKSCEQAASPQEKQERMHELESAGKKLVNSLKKADTQAFLALCSKNGLGFEGDEYVTLEQIKDSFKEKSAFYCLLFDTECARQKYPDSEKEYSFRDVFSQDKGPEVRSYFLQPGGPGTEEDTCGGDVVVSWQGEPKWYLPGVTFTFSYEDGTWKLTGFTHFITK